MPSRKLSSPLETITILGAGYVGLTTAALLASAGYVVYALEPHKNRLKTIRQGRSFFYEAGLDSLIKTALDNGSLIPTDSYSDSIAKSSIVFSCVGTPDKPDGSTDLGHVFAAAQEAVLHLKSGSIFVQKSTVPVGTGRLVEALFRQAGPTIDYVSNPEFLREGTAVYDSLYFDRIVVGGDNQTAINAILDVYRILESNRDDIAAVAGIKAGKRRGDYIATNLNSAELIKVTANAFLALKISFANSIAKLADQVGANISEVMEAVGADDRIGRQFLKTGRGYGGGCFPKDVSGLIASGRQHGLELEIMTAAQAVNASMPGYIINKLELAVNRPLTGLKIAILGLAFKAGTSDVRQSPGITLANQLQQTGAIVVAYDPQAMVEARLALIDGIRLTDSIQAAVQNATVVIVATDWPEFLTYGPTKLASDMAGHWLVDGVNQFSKQAATKAGLIYLGVGQ